MPAIPPKTKVPLMFLPLWRYVDFQGRSRRTEFWLWCLFQVLVFMGLEALLFGTMPWASLQNHPEAASAHLMSFIPFLNLVQLALFLPNLAVSVRRLHDSNRTGWWVLMPLGVIIAGLILWAIINAGTFAHLDQLKNNDGKPLLAFLGSLVLCVYLPALVAGVVIFVFYVLDGTPGNNRFGPDPKGRGNIDVFN